MPSSGLLRYLEAPAPAGAAPARSATLVLLHAFPLNARMWEPQFALAEHGWRVIAPQLRGFEGSVPVPSATSMDDYAGDVIDLLDTLHIEDAVIGGLSMGGYVAFALFRQAPQYFRALILADTRAQADTPEAKRQREGMLNLARERGAPAILDEMLPRLVSEQTRTGRRDVIERIQSLALSNSATALSGAILAMMTRNDSTPLLPTIDVPTLILVGEDDAVTPPALSEDMRRAIPGAELVTIPSAGHLSNLEQPEAFNDAVRTFLDLRLKNPH